MRIREWRNQRWVVQRKSDLVFDITSRVTTTTDITIRLACRKSRSVVSLSFNPINPSILRHSNLFYQYIHQSLLIMIILVCFAEYIVKIFKFVLDMSNVFM